MATTFSPEEVGVQVGDFFVSSWGYDQTNIDFYKVVGVTPKGVKIQKWTAACVESESSGYTDALVPGDGPVMERDTSAVTPEMDYWDAKEATVLVPAKVQTKRIGGSVTYPSIKVRSFAWAHKWTGGAEHQTAMGFGH